MDFRTETLDVLTRIGDAVPADIDLGYHLCYGSPQDEHMVLPEDSGIMVEMTNAIVAGVSRNVQFFHIPVIKERTDDSYFAPMEDLKLGPDTELYLGLIHPGDAKGDQARLEAARRHTRVDGVGTDVPSLAAYLAEAPFDYNKDPSVVKPQIDIFMFFLKIF